MTISTMPSREFNQDVSKAKRRASEGPLFITDRGEPAYVLLTIRSYEELVGRLPTIVELLEMPGDDDIEFDPPRLEGEVEPAVFC